MVKAWIGRHSPVSAPPGRDRRSIGIRAVDALDHYVRHQGTVTPALRGNITIV